MSNPNNETPPNEETQETNTDNGPADDNNAGGEESGGENKEKKPDETVAEKIAETKEEIETAIKSGDLEKADKILNRLEQWLEQNSTLTTKLTEQIAALESKIASIQPTPSETKSTPQSQPTEQPEPKNPDQPNSQNENADGQKDQKPAESPRARRKAI